MRLLIITENKHYLDPARLEYAQLVDHAGFTDYTYLVVLTQEGTALSREQLTPNVWRLATESSFGFSMVRDALALTKELPLFDLVVAEEPHRAGVVAARFAKERNLPFQVRIRRGDLRAGSGLVGHFFSPLARTKRVIEEASCIRTDDVSTYDALDKLGLLRGKQSAVVPRVALERTVVPEGTFPKDQREEDHPELQFKVFVHVNERTHLGRKDPFTIFRRLAAIYPWIGMVVVGSEEAERRVKRHLVRHGGFDRIFFRRDPDDLMHALEIAQVVLMNDADAVDDEVLRAALAQGRAIVLPESLTSSELVPGEQCLACPSGDAECFERKVRDIVENNAVRLRLEVEARTLDTTINVTSDERRERLVQSYARCASRELS